MDFGLYRASIQSTFVPLQTKVHFRFPEFGGIGQTLALSTNPVPCPMSAETQRGPMFDMCVCSVYYQPNPSRRRWTVSRPPAGCVPGSVGNPFDRAWPPTTSGDLQPIFSCVDSRGTHPLCVYVREYGMWCVRGYVLGEGGVNASTSTERNSKLEG